MNTIHIVICVCVQLIVSMQNILFQALILETKTNILEIHIC